MTIANIGKALGATVLALAASACGGGGGVEVASIPPAPIAPVAPPPPAVAQGALAAPPSGIFATTNFATVGDDVGIRWNAALGAYEITIPELVAGRILQTSYGPYGAAGNVVDNNGGKLFGAFALTPFSYTGIIELYADGSEVFKGLNTVTAFGVPTPAGSVPVTGSATYAAQLDGYAGGWELYGTAALQFDFGAGKLTGFMQPQTNGPMGSPTLPRYNFTQTIYSSGSTTFSGAFDVAGPTPSSFSGQFTGPSAQELMASFKGPFLDWDAQGNPTVWNVMEGVMIGKRQ